MNSVLQVQKPYVNFFTSVVSCCSQHWSLFPNSRLSTVHTSLVALTQFSITVLHGFTSTTFAKNYKFHSRNRPLAALLSSTLAKLHAHGSFAATLTPAFHLPYTSVFSFPKHPAFSSWSIL
jgi:hypothetical protein